MFSPLMPIVTGSGEGGEGGVAASEVPIFFGPAITDYIGGGATNLDGKNAAGYTSGQVGFIIHFQEGIRFFQVEISADPTDSPNWIRAADWAITTKGFRLKG